LPVISVQIKILLVEASVRSVATANKIFQVELSASSVATA